MSVLLVGVEPDLARAVIARLLAQGDQVRAVVAPGQDPAPFEGAHLATGDPADDDLVERAAQGARTIVLGATAPAEAALDGAARARVERAVFVGRAPGDDLPEGMSWVALVTPRPRLGRRRGPSPEALAEAVDAADDLAGEPRLVADLSTPEGWAALRLDPPA